MYTVLETEIQSANQLINRCDWLQSDTYSRFSSRTTLGKSAGFASLLRSENLNFSSIDAKLHKSISMYAKQTFAETSIHALIATDVSTFAR